MDIFPVRRSYVYSFRDPSYFYLITDNKRFVLVSWQMKIKELKGKIQHLGYHFTLCLAVSLALLVLVTSDNFSQKL